MATPASRAPSTAKAKCGSSGDRSGAAPVRSSLARSLVPMTSTFTRGCPAIARISRMAVGVSTIAQIVMAPGAPAASSRADTSSRYAADPTLGMTMAAAPEPAAAAMSSAPHGVSRPLQRIVISRCPYSPDCAAATALVRAASFASGATASSRSKMSASVGMVFAFWSARSFDDGIYSTERRGRSSLAASMVTASMIIV